MFSGLHNERSHYYPVTFHLFGNEKITNSYGSFKNTTWRTRSSEKDAGQFTDWVQRYFRSRTGSKERSSFVQYKTETGDVRPIRQPRRSPLAKREDSMNRDMEGVNEPSSNSWATPVVVIHKKALLASVSTIGNWILSRSAASHYQQNDILDTLTDSKLNAGPAEW